MYNGMPILYIIMRTDLASMNPGKAIAQGSHAANQAVALTSADPVGQYLVKEWEGQTLNIDTGENLSFGTVFTLAGGSMETISNMIAEIDVRTMGDIGGNRDTYTGIVFDPSYPIRDGETTHHIPLHTCAWVFTRYGSKAQKILSALDLHP